MRTAAVLTGVVITGCATSRPAMRPPQHAVQIISSASERTEALVVAEHGAFLVIDRVAIRATGVCRAYEPMLEVDAIVTNRGDATSPSFEDYGMVAARFPDMRSQMGNGGGFPALEPGESTRVRFPVFFPIGITEVLPQAAHFEVKLDYYDRYPEAIRDTRVITLELERAPCTAAATRAR